MVTKVRWGILGTGMITGALIRGIRASGNGELVAIASRDLDKAEKAAAEHNIPRAYGSYEELLADREVEAIYNPLPNALHAPWTIKAAVAKKHILCEKPLAPTPAECARMIVAAKKHRVVLMEAFMYRFHPQTKKIKELIDAGAIGKLLQVRSAFTFNLNLNDLSNVRLSKSLIGGSVMDVGCYCINLSRYLFGREPSEVFGVANYGKKSRVDEQMIGVLRFGEGVAYFDSSFQVTFRAFAEAVGSAGKIVIPSPWKPPNPSTITLTSRGKTEEIIVQGGDPYKLQVDHFNAVVRRKAKLGFPPTDGVANARVMQALLKSARKNCVVRVTP